MIGGKKVIFNNEMSLAEMERTDKNYTLAYLLQGNGLIPETHKIQDLLEYYT